MVDYKLATEFLKNYDAYITRPGADSLRRWLTEESDFFSAPASTKYHGNFEGGLCQHSLGVFQELGKLVIAYKDIVPDITLESVAIAGLLHDVCKVNFYQASTRNVKNEDTGKWEKVPCFVHNEKFKYGGHGGKSVYLIMKHMQLTEEEAVAINCHMGAFEFGSSVTSTSQAYEQYPFAWLLHVADEAAAFIRRV